MPTTKSGHIRYFICLAAFAAGASLSTARQLPPTAPSGRIEGDWRVVFTTLDGMKSEPAITAHITADRFELTMKSEPPFGSGGLITLPFSYKSEKVGGTSVLRFRSEGLFKGKTKTAAYQLRGDELDLVYNDNTWEGRIDLVPDRLDAVKGSGRYLMRLQRVVSEKK